MLRLIKLALLVTAVAALAIAAVGCGGEQTTDEAKQQLTTDMQAFDESVQQMKSLTVNSTVDEWQAARQDAQEAWDKVVASAADVKEAEVGDVQTAWDNLAKSVDDLGDATLQEAVPQLREEIAQLKAAYDDLYNGLK